MNLSVELGRARAEVRAPNNDVILWEEQDLPNAVTSTSRGNGLGIDRIRISPASYFRGRISSLTTTALLAAVSSTALDGAYSSMNLLDEAPSFIFYISHESIFHVKRAAQTASSISSARVMVHLCSMEDS